MSSGPAFGDDKQDIQLSPAGIDGETFLLAEFNFLSQFRLAESQLADKRADVWLTLVSAILAGAFILVSQTGVISLEVKLILILSSSAVLALIGSLTFWQVIHLSISVAEHTRGINRIRSYFGGHYQRIQPYIFLPIDYNHPPYRLKSGGYRTVAVVNAVLWSVAIACALFLIRLNPPLMHVPWMTSTWLALLTPLVVFFATLLGYEQAAARTFNTSEARADKVRNQRKMLYGSTQYID